ncbi:MAG TPA: hypothetical protein VH394_11250 [Thermoanaerobaculia bacterium]|jgi:hypothetical protein|nr:hypothetical protein [Thermoanaerobaculia bacterium]
MPKANGRKLPVVREQKQLKSADHQEVHILAEHRPSPPDSEAAPPPASFPACSGPDLRVAPQFVIPIRRPIVLKDLGDISPPANPQVSISCVAALGLEAQLGFDTRFEQTWDLTKLSIGDLSSTIGLAPGEKLTLEFQTSQRKVMDRSVMDSSENIDSSESVTSDKEAINVTRATSKTQNWHVDTTGTLTCGAASLSVSAGYSQSVTDSNQQTINHVTEATRKSAQSLKSLHKIEVRGISESLVQNRMTRLIRNPYIDRTLSINVFQLAKHFAVKTVLAETRIALLLQFKGIRFDSHFVVENADFLRSTLLDSSLLDQLSTAIQGATSKVDQDSLRIAREVAERALYHLFENPNIFNVPDVGGVNANAPGSSYNAQLVGIGDTALGDSLSTHFVIAFTTMSFYYALYKDPKFDRTKDDNVIRMAVALAQSLDEFYKLMVTDPLKDPSAADLKNIMDADDLTEFARRMTGFMSMVKGILNPLLEPAKLEKDALRAQNVATLVMQRLVQHLNCNASYYLQEFLRYVERTTNGQGIVDLVNQSFEILKPTLPPFVKRTDFDIDRSFIEKAQIIVPGFVKLTPDQVRGVGKALFGTDPGPVLDPVPTVVEVEVPADGIHLEVAAGECILKNVPDRPGFELDLDLSNLKVNASGEIDCHPHP